MTTKASEAAGADEMLDTAAAAKFLHVAPVTLEIWRSVGRNDLPYYKVGRLVRYRLADLEGWLQSRARTRTV